MSVTKKNERKVEVVTGAKVVRPKVSLLKTKGTSPGRIAKERKALKGPSTNRQEKAKRTYSGSEKSVYGCLSRLFIDLIMEMSTNVTGHSQNVSRSAK